MNLSQIYPIYNNIQSYTPTYNYIRHRFIDEEIFYKYPRTRGYMDRQDKFMKKAKDNDIIPLIMLTPNDYSEWFTQWPKPLYKKFKKELKFKFVKQKEGTCIKLFIRKCINNHWSWSMSTRGDLTAVIKKFKNKACRECNPRNSDGIYKITRKNLVFHGPGTTLLREGDVCDFQLIKGGFTLYKSRNLPNIKIKLK